MTDLNEKINQLQDRLESLMKRQEDFSKEITILRIEINYLKSTSYEKIAVKEETDQVVRIVEPDPEIKKQNLISDEPIPQPIYPQPFTQKSNLEKFIGENLINKIGIAITVIGVGIGTKYSIEHGLISPLTRIILGYLFGLGLLGLGMKLKSRYENYSAVLVSGAISILYFITYSACAIYDLIPQAMAFGLMVIFTVFTVIAAIHYNRQVIAHIGLVGAYAVPFLLSEGSKDVAFLFSYMAIINIGILAIAFKRYWKPLYYSSFGLTWLIYFIWYVTDYQSDKYFLLAMGFLSAFFAIFYLTFLTYKLLKKEKFDVDDTILLLLNSFIYYGIGYAILDTPETGDHLLGLFTLFNAIIHFIISVVIYRQKLADRNLFYLVTGLVLVFITITFPVQMNGNWVTLLWAGEAALLFWIGRNQNVSFYEKISYPLMILAFVSIMQDWSNAYGGYISEDPGTRITPLLNIHFISSMLFISVFGFINILNKKRKSLFSTTSQHFFPGMMGFLMPAILVVSLYLAFLLEISNYWSQQYTDSAIKILKDNQQYANYFWNYDLESFKAIWMINYSLIFISILAFANMKKFKNNLLGLIGFGLTILIIVIFLTLGLYTLSELRESYLTQQLVEYYKRGAFNLIIRYVSLAFVAVTLLICHRYVRQDPEKRNRKITFNLLLHISILWIASSEFIHWMDMAASTQSYKLGLSILWGVYSLFMISIGIWKKNKSLRMGAIVLFGVTLIKLFFFDLSHLNTISKTIVFVSLGILLLVTSFLYHKFKHIISDEVSL